MKVGDYVRTKYGIAKYIGDKATRVTIYKVINKDIVYDNVDGWENILLDKEIIKSSPNIIDLIEEHDILKIEEQKGVYTICEVEEFRDPYVNYKFLGVRLENQSRARKLYELNIKSIVTHEQFSQMEYRIGE